MARARSQSEQEQIVLGWRRSGQSARSYAAVVGVSTGSLYRWSSLLRESVAEQPTELVEVVTSEAAEPSWEWEVELPAGTLRVRGALTGRTARAIVEALASARRR
jgi:hypothetical protein